jgi:quinol monooxygenase YgiN
LVTRVVVQTVDPERREAYVEEFKAAWRRAALPGCRSAKILRAIERNPGRVILIFEWDSLEAQRQADATPAYQRLMRETIRAYQSAASDSAHYEVEDI